MVDEQERKREHRSSELSPVGEGIEAIGKLFKGFQAERSEPLQRGKGVPRA